MFYLRFQNSKNAVQATVTKINEGVVRVSPVEPMADNLSGFKIYLDKQLTHMVGDYTLYRTRYRDTDADGMYLSTGEVYVAPTAPDPEQEPTPEEIAERERQERIAGIQMQIAGLKAQIDSTDYRIIKAYEYSTVGMEADYDLAALHVDRQALRDQINTLEAELEEIINEQGGQRQ